MVRSAGTSTRYDIPPEYMEPIRDLWCTNDGRKTVTPSQSRSAGSRSFGTNGDAKVTFERSLSQEVGVAINSDYEEPKFDWCVRGSSGGRGTANNTELAYTLNNGWWSLFKIWLPSVADSTALCDRISSWVDTFGVTLRDDVNQMITQQRVVVENKAWYKPREAEFNKRFEACLKALTPNVDLVSGTEHFGYAEYQGQSIDLESLCVGAMEMLVPAPQLVEKKVEPKEDAWNMLLLPGRVEQKADQGPVEGLKEYFDMRLRGIPWNEWVRLEEFCIPLSKTNTIVTGIKGVVYAVGTAGLWFVRNYLKATLRVVFSEFADMTIIPIGKAVVAFKALFDKKGPGDPPDAGTGSSGGGSGAPVVESAPLPIAAPAPVAVPVAAPAPTPFSPIPELHEFFSPAGIAITVMTYYAVRVAAPAIVASTAAATKAGAAIVASPEVVAGLQVTSALCARVLGAFIMICPECAERKERNPDQVL